MSESLKASLRSAERRFVVLYHEMPEEDERASHFDWMFESGNSLRTWAVEENSRVTDFLKNPNNSVPFQCAAERLADHRPIYLEYEGQVSHNRGTVFRRLSGEIEVIDESDDSFRCRLRIGENSNLDPIDVYFKQVDEGWSLMLGAVSGEAPKL